jgi:serine/threonine-protein kinase
VAGAVAGITERSRVKPSEARDTVISGPRLRDDVRAVLPEVGDTFDGKYRIDALLGIGGMGAVFAATHLRLGQPVALKMLLPEWADEPSVVRRFALEGRASGAIRSEHIARVFDVDDCDGRPYLVLEYLDGLNFDALLAETGPMAATCAIDFLLQACEAIAEAHAAGTIHRDLKPANLFLARGADGLPCVKVLDFGISKLAQVAQTLPAAPGGSPSVAMMGSPKYMSPEQMRSPGDVDERSDIWSLGAVLYELLSGTPPFSGETVTEICAHVLSDTPPPLSETAHGVPAGLEQIVAHCLEKNRDARYATVAELARALAPFGTAAARTSAEKIARVREGLGPRSTRSPSLGRPPLSARARLELETVAPRGIGRRIGAYVLALAVAGSVAWMITSHYRADRRPAACTPTEGRELR